MYLLIALIFIILYYLRKSKKNNYNKINKQKKFVYNAKCIDCKWNHRDIQPKCENTCIKNFGKDYKYNLKWKKLNQHITLCNCIKK